MLSVDRNKLYPLIGRHLVYRGISCRVIDILEEGPCLVLQTGDDDSVIQANQYGEPSRRAPRILTVAVLNVRRDALNPALPGLAALL